MVPLPPRYKILPHAIPLSIPGFRLSCPAPSRTLAPERVDCEAWFESFADRVAAAVGRRYLPVCRMSDGEFRMLLGDQPPSPRTPLLRWAWRWGRYLRRRLGGAPDFAAATMPGVSSGDYSNREVRAVRAQYGADLRRLSEEGILALHLSYGERPFNERFYPAMGRWLEDSGVRLTLQNYAPFYFVYALLVGGRRRELLRGRRVLAVNGAGGDKRAAIIRGLEREGARVSWGAISASRSLYDRLPVERWQGRMDLALVGAGVGTPRLLLQLSPLGVPALDVGYLFEVWADPRKRWLRTMCVPDAEYDPRRVRWVRPWRQRSPLARALY
jgi:hypothetical protein